MPRRSGKDRRNHLDPYYVGPERRHVKERRSGFDRRKDKSYQRKNSPEYEANVLAQKDLPPNPSHEIFVASHL